MSVKAPVLLLMLGTLLSAPAQADQRPNRPAHPDRRSLLSCSMPNAWYCQVLLRKKVPRPSLPH